MRETPVSAAPGPRGTARAQRRRRAPSTPPPPPPPRTLALPAFTTFGAIVGAMSSHFAGASTAWTLATICASALAALSIALVVRDRRIAEVARFMELRAADAELERRLPPMGGGLDGRLARAANGVLARATELSAQLVDQSLEIEATHRELALSADLARKTQELDRRREERAILFEVMRESAATHDLDRVLSTLAKRLGPTLRFREVAVLIAEGERLSIRAAWGFADPDVVVGRSIGLGEGVTGLSAEALETKVIDDVALAPDYLAFWGEVPRTGSFLSVPVRSKGELIGMLALTRPPTDPLSETETRFVEAVANQVALAIRNAQMFEQLTQLTLHDPLTGLPNRRLFEQRIERGLSDARRYDEPLSLLAVDIDHFKKLNDREGHPVGDQALIAVARALESKVRAVDTVARTGGEEFLVILSRAGETEAKQVAEKLRRAVAKLDVQGAPAQPLGHLSISIGVATLEPDDDSAVLIRRADAALYHAKALGRDRVSTRPPPPGDDD